MKMEFYSIEQHREELEECSYSKNVLFALRCCERLYPNFVFFSSKFRTGDPVPLRQSLDFSWLSLLDDERKIDVSEYLFSSIESQMPDTECFDTIYVSSALDACAACLLLLEFLRHRRLNRILEIATLARDTVDMFVQELENLPPNDPDIEKKIQAHELMQNEIKVQKSTMMLLKSINTITPDIVVKLKEEWSNLSKGSINIDVSSIS